jgi:hypothetical protein
MTNSGTFEDKNFTLIETLKSIIFASQIIFLNSESAAL